MCASRVELRWQHSPKWVSDTCYAIGGILHPLCLDSFRDNINAHVPQITFMLQDSDSDVRSSGADMITKLAAYCEWRMVVSRTFC